MLFLHLLLPLVKLSIIDLFMVLLFMKLELLEFATIFFQGIPDFQAKNCSIKMSGTFFPGRNFISLKKNFSSRTHSSKKLIFWLWIYKKQNLEKIHQQTLETNFFNRWETHRIILKKRPGLSKITTNSYCPQVQIVLVSVRMFFGKRRLFEDLEKAWIDLVSLQ